MYDIYFYKDKNGHSPVLEYLQELTSKKDKDSRIKANKISSYIDMLRMYGTQIGEPYIKHLDDDIWELRPIRDRILFAAWDGSNFILLSCFMKQTQKTPQREIEKAKSNLVNFRKRSDNHES